MAAHSPFASAAQTAGCIRLLRFYLPRLLAPQPRPLPELWCYATALQQLGKSVLANKQLTSQPLQAEHRLVRQRLACLRRLLWGQSDVPQQLPSLSLEATNWPKVQVLLRQTMPHIERLLLEDQQAWYKKTVPPAEKSHEPAGQRPAAEVGTPVWERRFEGAVKALEGLLDGLGRIRS
jgi:hypothetical protein